MEALNTYGMEAALRERVLEILSEMKMTKAELALRIRYSRSAVSRYLSGKYDSDPSEIETRLTEFVQAYEESTGQGDAVQHAQGGPVAAVKPKIEYFESRDFIQTIGVCKACQENMALGIIVAKSGYGNRGCEGHGGGNHCALS